MLVMGGTYVATFLFSAAWAAENPQATTLQRQTVAVYINNFVVDKLNPIITSLPYILYSVLEEELVMWFFPSFKVIAPIVETASHKTLYPILGHSTLALIGSNYGLAARVAAHLVHNAYCWYIGSVPTMPRLTIEQLKQFE
jgi:hypothetical protein